ALPAGLAAAGYAIGAASALARQRTNDVVYILQLREELRLSQNHIMENATFLSLGAYVDAAAEEIRQPLHAAAAAAQSLASDPGLAEAARATAGALRSHLDSLRAALGHLARYELTEPARAPFGVNTLLREAVRLCRHRGEERKIRFEERYEVVPPVFGPAGR